MRVRELDARGHGGAAAAAFVCRHAGRAHAVAVLKATFTIVPGGVTSIAVPGVFESDEQTAPSRGAMRATRPSDVSPPLPGAEVLLDASAFSAQGTSQGAVAVRLYVASRAGAIDKTLHVYGDRTPSAPQPQPFERMPIVWERAIGGVSSDNPVGRPVGDPSGLANVVHAQQAWVPAGLGPIAASWPARRRLVGDGGEPVVRQGELVVPDDLPFAWFHAAPADQRLAAFERELWLVLDGMHPTLPRLSTKLLFAEACARLRLATGVTRLVELKVDRLFVEAERGLVTATWRGWSPIEDDLIAGLSVEAGLGPWPPPEAFFDTDPASETLDSGSAQAALRAVLPWARASMDQMRSTSSSSPSRAGLPFAAPPQPSPPQASPSSSPGSVFPASPPPAPLVRAAPALAGLPFVPAPSPLATRAAERPSTSGTPFGPAVPAFPSAKAPLEAADDVLDESTTDASPSTPRTTAFATVAAPRAVPPAVVATTERIEDERTFDASSEPGLELVSDEDALAGTIALVSPSRLALGEGNPPLRPPLPPARVGALSLGTSPLGLRPPLVAAAPLDDTTNDTASEPIPRPSVVLAANASVATTGERFAHADSVPDEPHEQELPRDARRVEEPHLEEPRLEGPHAGDDSTGMRAVLLARVRERASVSDLVLEGADLQGIDLRGADLRDAKLTRARLVGAQLDGASLVGAVLVEADLSSASLVGADLARADLSRATLNDAALERAVLERARLVLAVLTRVRGPGLRADHAALEGVHADDACLAGASLQFVDLRGGRLNRADLSEVVLVGADLTDVQASGARLDGATLTDVRAVGATFQDGSARGARAERSNWERAQLERSDWSDADLSECKLERALATGANFSRARLRDADLTALVADDAQLVDAVIDGAELRQARLAGARASGVSARGVVAPKLAAPGLGAEGSDWSGATLRTAKLRGARFEDANLDGVDLRDADLVEADLRGAVRATTKLGGASLRGAKRTDVEPPPTVD